MAEKEANESEWLELDRQAVSTEGDRVLSVVLLHGTKHCWHVCSPEQRFIM